MTGTEHLLVPDTVLRIRLYVLSSSSLLHKTLCSYYPHSTEEETEVRGRRWLLKVRCISGPGF
jgi:hypothetical protein